MNGGELTRLLSREAVAHAARIIDAGHEATTLRTPKRAGPVFAVFARVAHFSTGGGVVVTAVVTPEGEGYAASFSYQGPRSEGVAVLTQALDELRREWFT